VPAENKGLREKKGEEPRGKAHTVVSALTHAEGIGFGWDFELNLK
jgi:hypothetical protein